MSAKLNTGQLGPELDLARVQPRLLELLLLLLLLFGGRKLEL